MDKTEDDGKNNKKDKKQERLHKFVGIDLCACGGGHKIKCHGVCRESHMDKGTAMVECGECYRIESQRQSTGDRRPRRTWKYGKQKDRRQDRQS